MSIEAMKLALDALESIWVYGADTLSGPVRGQPDDRKFQRDGVAEMTKRARLGKEALRQAIEAAEKQEPVGQLSEEAFGRNQVFWFNKPKDHSMLYTAPPKREWVGLTEEDLSVCDEDGVILARYWEAKLREKNGC